MQVSALYIVAGIDASKSKFTTVVVLGKISITVRAGLGCFLFARPAPPKPNRFGMAVLRRHAGRLRPIWRFLCGQLCQIITQLGVALELDWPDSFDWFVNLLKVRGSAPQCHPRILTS